MDDRASIELREEPSEATDALESGRRAIRKEAGKSILLGSGIVLHCRDFTIQHFEDTPYVTTEYRGFVEIMR